jgi:CBS domain-containing protein
MQAKDVMTTQVLTVRPDTPVAEIAKLLLDHHISGVPVVSADGQIRGIVSEGDLMRRADADTERRSSWWLGLFGQADTLAERYAKSHGHVAADVMTQDVVTITESTPLSDIATMLEEKRVKRLPVVRDGRIVGIVSRANLLRALASRAAAPPDNQRDDRTIREALLAEIDGQPWAHLTDLNIIVERGTVHLWGTIGSESERKALRIAAEDVAGATRVEDHLLLRSKVRFAE